MITGLPIRGEALILPPRSADWREQLRGRFHKDIPRQGSGQLARGVPLHWLRHFQECPLDADDGEVRTHLVAYLLWLFGWIMFPTSHGNIVNPAYIRLAESLADAPIDEIAVYSWGSAMLCATYKGLCDASVRSKGKEPILSACHCLLQLWSWEHFPVGRLTITHPIHPYAAHVEDPTMGTRWTCATLRWGRAVSVRCYLFYHQEFEMLEEQAVIWSPWKDAHLHSVAPLGLSPSCYNDATLWLTTCHLVFSNMVEPYAPQRVMRQFGLFQTVPPQPTRGLDEASHEYVPNFIIIENYI